MNKTELIAAMAEKSGLTKKDCEKAFDSLTVSIEGALKRRQGCPDRLWLL